MHIENGGGREAAFAVPTASVKSFGIHLGDLRRLKLSQKDCSQCRHDVAAHHAGVPFECFRRDLRPDMLKPPLHVRADCNLCRFQVGAALQRTNQPRTFTLRLPLRPDEGVPFPASTARRGITDFQNDCPAAG
jgi:hypothetical protein